MQMSAGSLPGTRIDVNGVGYHVADLGEGPPVLLLHGMPDTSGAWRHQAHALVGAGYRVVVPDMLGYGETDKPTETARYGAEQILGDLVALLDALDIERTDVIGHDWGAFASWELALNLPQRFRRHVALSVGHPDTFLGGSSVEDVRASWYMYLNATDGAADLYSANDGEWFRTVLVPTHPEIDEVWSRLEDPAAMRAMLNWDRANPMARLYLSALVGDAAGRPCTVPTLGIWSEGDTYLWETQMQESEPLMDADWRYARVAGSHWAQLDHPEEVNALILDWLAG